MPRTNQDGKDIRLTIGWLLGRPLSDAEMAEALDIPAATYSRRKDQDEFPSFEELQLLADKFQLHALALQVAFGYLDTHVVLLDEVGMRQYMEQGGALLCTKRQQDEVLDDGLVSQSSRVRRMRRPDAPPGP